MMNQQNQPILPSFADTDVVNNLRFHVRELFWDITNLTTQLDATFAMIPINVEDLDPLKYELESIISGIDHDVRHHLAETLKISSIVIGRQDFFQKGEELTALVPNFLGDDDEQDNNNLIRQQGIDSENIVTLPIINEHINQLVIFIRKAHASITTITRIQGRDVKDLDQIQHELQYLAKVLGIDAWQQAIEIYRNITALQLITNPTPEDEEEVEVLAEHIHPTARSLQECPKCGAPLSSDDRTLNGSICEICKTLWRQQEVSDID